MPAPPEVPDRPRPIGVEKVLPDLEAEHVAHADGHVAVAGEVIVDLQRVADRAQPGQADVPGAAVEDRVGDIAHRVRYQQLLGKAQDKAADPLLRPDGIADARVDLRGDIVVFHDGARDQLGKKGDIEEELRKAPGAVCRIPVAVDHIGQALEGVKGNADRQDDPRRGQAQILQDEIRILEHRQQPQVQDHCRRQRRPALPAPHQQAPCQIVNEHREQEQRDIIELPEGIKDEAGQRQDRVLPPQIPPQSIQKEHGRQKGKQENGRRKNHAPRSFPENRSILS